MRAWDRIQCTHNPSTSRCSRRSLIIAPAAPSAARGTRFACTSTAAAGRSTEARTFTESATAGIDGSSAAVTAASLTCGEEGYSVFRQQRSRLIPEGDGVPAQRGGRCSTGKGSRKPRRPETARAAPQCDARTRVGVPCRAPCVRNRPRSRMRSAEPDGRELHVVGQRRSGRVRRDGDRAVGSDMAGKGPRRAVMQLAC